MYMCVCVAKVLIGNPTLLYAASLMDCGHWYETATGVCCVGVRESGEEVLLD